MNHLDGADSAQSVFPEWKSFLGTSSDEEAKSFLKKVVKRSGEIENYDRKKIEKAVGKAVQAVEKIANPEKAERLTDAVEEQLRLLLAGRRAHSIPAIEEIQDVVETVLIQSGEVEIAKAYILYRAKHEAMRDAKKLAVDINKTMDGYLSQSDWRVHENANINFSLGGLILHNSGTITANYWLRNIYPKEIADAHINCAFHIHDLSMFSGYCAGWSLRQLIKEGLGGVKEKITCAPAAHLSTLVNQMVNFLGILQNEWAGAQAFSSFDTFVKADSLSEKEVRQCIQSFIFGVNTPSRWGSQAPFTNITLDWTCPEDLRNQKAVVAGKETDFTYGDCQKEMDVINKVFIELMLKGDDAGRGFAYPIPTYNITKDFDWENPNCALLFQMTSQYGTPYFQNFINSDLNPSDVRSMCCRLRLDKRELKKRGGGLFGSDEFTGSLGVVTINLPQIGFLAKSAQNPSGEFYRRLDHLMDLARDSLQIKRKVIQKLLDGGLFPYTRRYLKTLDNHFNTIGLCGMNECCLNLLGKDITTSEGKDFACKVLDHMRERMADYQEKTGELFNLEATPAESTSYRLARHDKENFPGIITSGKDDPFYTNSSQLPVDFTSDIFEALDHQEALQTRYTGGTVFHIFVGEQVKDWRACKELIKTVFTNYRIPYITVSPVYSVCKKHGYIPGEHFECPKCKAEKEAALRQKLALLQTQKQELIQKQKLA